MSDLPEQFPIDPPAPPTPPSPSDCHPEQVQQVERSADAPEEGPSPQRHEPFDDLQGAGPALPDTSESKALGPTSLAAETWENNEAPQSSSPAFVPAADDSPLLFQDFIRPIASPQERVPHMGHIGILFLISIAGLICAWLIARAAVTAHLFGVSSLNEAATEFHYTLGTEAIFYILTLAGCLIVFPLLWHKSFFAGLQWRGKAALSRSGYLFSAALVCFLLAMLDGIVMPGPSDAPIDKLFRVPGAAWLLFAFGVTLAPFFEELGFRGFLLPALCTAFDWIAEKVTDQPPHYLDENGHPRWSMPAMIVAALLTSILFALMHAEQTSYSVGPLLLLVCVSLVLCAARLLTRSLAASVLVHATYNFLLFTFMFLGTGGFKHLENM